MKISYDKEAEAMSIVMSEGRISKDVEVAENVYAGFDRKGALVEIQILEVSKADAPWFTLGAAAKYLNVSQRTLLRWIKNGKLSPSKVGREYRIKPNDLKKIAS
jgi:excisionase family DNA binding protein